MERRRWQQNSHCFLPKLVMWRWMMTSMMTTLTLTMMTRRSTYATLNDIIKPAAPHSFALSILVVEELYVVSLDEPASFAKVECSPSWRKVMMEEMISIEENII
jgi:hypothetical protein